MDFVVRANIYRNLYFKEPNKYKNANDLEYKIRREQGEDADLVILYTYRLIIDEYKLKINEKF